MSGTFDPILGQSNLQQNTDWFTAIPKVSASKATITGSSFFNPGDNGMIINLVVANKVGTPTFAVEVHSTDDAGNDVKLVAFTAVAINAIYYVHPHADKSATSKSNFTEEGTLTLPRKWNFVLTYAGNGSTDVIDIEVHVCYTK